MNYLKFLQKSLRLVVKYTLEETAAKGLGSNYFYITFKTNYSKVLIPHYLFESYPNTMTIIFQHEFWDLKIYEDFFSVNMMFSGVIEKLCIPFNAISKFEDPTTDFVLDFIVDEKLSDDAEKKEIKQDITSEENIIDLNSFRK